MAIAVVKCRELVRVSPAVASMRSRGSAKNAGQARRTGFAEWDEVLRCLQLLPSGILRRRWKR
jgi:hypothetical protein